MNEHPTKQHNMQSPEDRDSIIYQKGFSAGTEHSHSSPETIKKISQMSEDITNLKVGQGKIETKIDSLTEMLKSHIAEEGEYRKSQDAYHKEIIEKKAEKWTEKVIIWTGISLGGIGLGLISWFVKTVFNKIF